MAKSIFSFRQVSIRSCVKGCSHNTVDLPRTRHNETGTPESNFADQNMTGGVGYSTAMHRLHPYRKQKLYFIIQNWLTWKPCKSCVERTVWGSNHSQSSCELKNSSHFWVQTYIFSLRLSVPTHTHTHWGNMIVLSETFFCLTSHELKDKRCNVVQNN